MATPTKTIRLRSKLRAEVEQIARRTRRSFSEVAQTLLDGALGTQACPGIYFADEPAGRVAKVAGTGLGVCVEAEIADNVAASTEGRTVQAALARRAE